MSTANSKRMLRTIGHGRACAACYRMPVTAGRAHDKRARAFIPMHAGKGRGGTGPTSPPCPECSKVDHGRTLAGARALGQGACALGACAEGHGSTCRAHLVQSFTRASGPYPIGTGREAMRCEPCSQVTHLSTGPYTHTSHTCQPHAHVRVALGGRSLTGARPGVHSQENVTQPESVNFRHTPCAAQCTHRYRWGCKVYLAVHCTGEHHASVKRRFLLT